MALQFQSPQQQTDPLASIPTGGLMKAAYQKKSDDYYDKVEDYFFSGGMLEGGLETTKALPTYDEAYSKYTQFANQHGQKPNRQEFAGYYSSMVSNYHNQLLGQSKILAAQGYDEDDIQDMIKTNPVIQSNIATIMREPLKGGEYATTMSTLIPAEKSAWEDVNPLYPGMVAAGLGYGGYKYGTSVPKDVYDEAVTNYRKDVRQARKLPDDWKTKTKLKFKGKDITVAEAEKILGKKKHKKGSRGDVKKLRERYNKTKKDLKHRHKKGETYLSSKKQASKRMREQVRAGQRYKNIKGKGVLPWFAPQALGMVGRMVGGDTGEALGTTAGVGYLGATQVPKALKGLKTKLPNTKKVPKSFLNFIIKRIPGMAAKAGVLSAADGPIPIGELLALGFTAMEVWNLYKVWKKALDK